ncbi:MAG TPA: hypothetical protein VFU62_10795 [Hanamia sp.]|nr:hypothetical protein [Hanamia sp.]
MDEYNLEDYADDIEIQGSNDKSFSGCMFQYRAGFMRVIKLK